MIPTTCTLLSKEVPGFIGFLPWIFSQIIGEGAYASGLSACPFVDSALVDPGGAASRGRELADSSGSGVGAR